jgi:hypothetical protein
MITHNKHVRTLQGAGSGVRATGAAQPGGVHTLEPTAGNSPSVRVGQMDTGSHRNLSYTCYCPVITENVWSMGAQQVCPAAADGSPQAAIYVKVNQQAFTGTAAASAKVADVTACAQRCNSNTDMPANSMCACVSPCPRPHRSSGTLRG